MPRRRDLGLLCRRVYLSAQRGRVAPLFLYYKTLTETCRTRCLNWLSEHQAERELDKAAGGPPSPTYWKMEAVSGEITIVSRRVTWRRTSHHQRPACPGPVVNWLRICFCGVELGREREAPAALPAISHARHTHNFLCLDIIYKYYYPNTLHNLLHIFHST